MGTTRTSSRAARTSPADRSSAFASPAHCSKSRSVLILDDSTSAVDTATDAKIRRAFAQRIPGTTKIIIAQRISSVQDADRIIVMDNGRVEAFDTHENLLKKSDLYREDL